MIDKLVALIKSDAWMMNILQIHQGLGLKDSWIGAGFVRNKVWDVLHHKTTPLNDIDVIYFDPKHSQKEELYFEQVLTEKSGKNNWSVKNQAYTHLLHNHLPYENCDEAISHWVETATSIAVRLQGEKIEVLSPYGVEDLFRLELKPVHANKVSVMESRMKQKCWLETWDKLKVVKD